MPNIIVENTVYEVFRSLATAQACLCYKCQRDIVLSEDEYRLLSVPGGWSPCHGKCLEEL